MVKKTIYREATIGDIVAVQNHNLDLCNHKKTYIYVYYINGKLLVTHDFQRENQNGFLH